MEPSSNGHTPHSEEEYSSRRRPFLSLGIGCLAIFLIPLGIFASLAYQGSCSSRTGSCSGNSSVFASYLLLVVVLGAAVAVLGGTVLFFRSRRARQDSD